MTLGGAVSTKSAYEMVYGRLPKTASLSSPVTPLRTYGI